MTRQLLRRLRPDSDQAANRWALALSVAAVATVVALQCLVRSPWDPDEIRYLLVAKHLSQHGLLLVPVLWGEPYLEKPPLYFWLVIWASRLGLGFHLSALLVPVAAAAALHLWLAQRIASQWLGRKAGAIAPLLLSSLILFPVSVSVGRMDPLMSVAITAACYLFYEGCVRGRRVAAAAGYVCCGLGVLFKGPFGAILPLAVLFVGLAALQRLRLLLSWTTLLGPLLMLLTIATWLAPLAYQIGVEQSVLLLERNLIQRAVAGVDHGQPAYFYALLLPAALLPWTGHFVSLCRYCWRSRSGLPEHIRYLWVWFIVPVVILTLVREKAALYLLPAMTPAALLLSWYMAEELLDSRGLARIVRTMRFAFAVSAAAAVLFALPWWLPDGSTAKHIAPGLAICILVIAVAGSVAFSLYKRLSGLAAVVTVAATSWVAMAAVSLAVLSRLEPVQSWREVAGEARIEGRLPLLVYKMRPYLEYHVGRPVFAARNVNELKRQLQLRQTLCVVVRAKHQAELLRAGFRLADVSGPYHSPKGPVFVATLSR